MSNRFRVHFAIRVVLILCVVKLLYEAVHTQTHASSQLFKIILKDDKVTSTKIAQLQLTPPNGSSDTSRKKLNNVFDCLNQTLCLKGVDSNTCLRKRNTETRFECSHFLTCSTVNGRTGNQIFQVTTLIGTAIYHGYTPIIDPSFPLTKLFDLPNVLHIRLDNIKMYKRAPPRNFDEGIVKLNHAYNWTLKGFMHSWIYFEGAEEEIRKALKIKQKFIEPVSTFMQNVVHRTVTRVCVHVRRGDYLHPINQKFGYVTAPVRYLKDAVEHFRKKHSRVHFFVITKDKKWCDENMKWNNVTISPFNSVELDFTLITLCDHAILTAGTFGWWGAWLAGGDVIYWTGYPREGSPLDKRSNKYDLYPREWIGMA